MSNCKCIDGRGGSLIRKERGKIWVSDQNRDPAARSKVLNRLSRYVSTFLYIFSPSFYHSCLLCSIFFLILVKVFLILGGGGVDIFWTLISFFFIIREGPEVIFHCVSLATTCSYVIFVRYRTMPSYWSPMLCKDLSPVRSVDNHVFVLSCIYGENIVSSSPTISAIYIQFWGHACF